ncbi:MAG: CHAD domain-containing protein [Ilumatobacteraceae bacterium]
MSFVIDPAAPTPREVRRITRACLDEAITVLDALGDGADIERAVDMVMRRCNEARALSRLVRPGLGGEFHTFNKKMRDAADLLAPIREAPAMLTAFDALRTRHPRDARLDEARAGLAVVVAEAANGLDHSDPRISRALELLRASRRSVERWDVPDGFKALGAGLADTYRRGRRALASAQAEPTDDRLRGWRQSVEQLSFQTRLIGQAAPSILERSASSLDGLAGALGDDHDLAVLIDRLATEPDRFGGAQAHHAVQLARAQQGDLRRRAFRLGATIYAERPREFRSRLRAYWIAAVEQGPELVAGGIAELAAEDERVALAARAHDPTKSVERERKFLVSNIPPLPDEGVALRQGYLAIDGSVSVRVRDADTEGCTLTVKAGRGGVRTELEWPLSRDEFDAAWQQTGGRRIHKTRYRLEYGEHLIELDVFHEELDGLVVAEVEFDSEESLAAFQPPAWFGREVTEDERFTNASLATNARLGPPTPLDD